MPTLLRVLVVEDSDNDTHLMLNELRRGGYDVEHERVETRAALRNALSHRSWDMILCDYTLPQFNAMNALTTLQTSGLDIPFLVVSGTVGEETAVAILKAGAHDFILKGRMARLVPAIERALQDAHTRRLHSAAEEERRKLIEKLESINAEIERFTYAAFHDLRAPLVTIKGFLGFLEKDLAAGYHEKVREDIQRITGAANHMDKLLADLLELFRIGRVGKPPEEVDLRQLAQEALQKLDALLRSKNIVVEVASDFSPVYGDRIRLREVFENLIENAAMYMGAQAHPRIEIGARMENGQQVIFVRDNGQGIEPRYHNRIFNLFETLDPNMQGAGIGLALTRRIVEVHRGRIWVESAGTGKGATFYFTIPDRRNL